MRSPLAPFRTWLFVLQIVIWSFFAPGSRRCMCGAGILPSKPRCKKLAQNKLPPLSRSDRKSISPPPLGHRLLILMIRQFHDTVADFILTLARAERNMLMTPVYYHMPVYITFLPFTDTPVCIIGPGQIHRGILF
jgi:hypothetical protein